MDNNGPLNSIRTPNSFMQAEHQRTFLVRKEGKTPAVTKSTKELFEVLGRDYGVVLPITCYRESFVELKTNGDYVKFACWEIAGTNIRIVEMSEGPW